MVSATAILSLIYIILSCSTDNRKRRPGKPEATMTARSYLE
jgi:hypothetical protein